MPTFLSKLFGTGPRKKAAKTAPSKTYVRARTDRAAIIAEAMEIYRRQRGSIGGALEKHLLEFRANVAPTLQDRDQLERGLALYSAQRDLRRLFAHDLKRYLVLAGIRSWLEQRQKPSKTA